MAEEVLSQGEVDALLSAIEQDDTDSSVEEPEGAVDYGDINSYDFKRPERVSKDQMRTLENIHENFARSLQASLSGYLRTIVEIKICTVEQLTYSEFIMSLPNPTCFNLLSAEPLEGSLVLEINPGILFAIIDKLLGGGNSEHVTPEREMTDIEKRLTGKLSNLAVMELKEMWSDIKRINFAVTGTESNPQLSQIVSPNEVVVLICFEIKMGEASGMMNLCMPFLTIEPIMGQFATKNWFSRGRKVDTGRSTADLKDNLKTCRVECVSYFAEKKISVGELLGLRVGDILETKKLEKDDLVFFVEDKPKYFVKAGQIRGKRSLVVSEKAQPGTRI
ncbi:MAG: flagellar motor switch protein FliM [Planctomycetota bacterium]|nr:MAG: flagellar motor switch protein FliM [Planctomycetota bacterium]